MIAGKIKAANENACIKNIGKIRLLYRDTVVGRGVGVWAPGDSSLVWYFAGKKKFL